MNEYWLISAPGDKTCQQTWETMNNVTSKQNSLCENFKFHIPDLKVGTLDQLVGLSDDLGKLDAYVETSTRKVAAYLGDVLEDQKDKLVENLLANNCENFSSLEPQLILNFSQQRNCRSTSLASNGTWRNTQLSSRCATSPTSFPSKLGKSTRT